MRLRYFLPVLLAAALGCGSSSSSPSGAKEEGSFKVALVTPGPVSDSGWNAMAYQGLEALKTDMGAETANQEASGPKVRDAMRQYAQDGYGLVFGHGYEYNEPGVELAKDFPETVFVSSSGGKTAANAGAFRFYLEQGCYQEALAQFEQALALDPHQAESWCSRADALSCLGRYEEALQSIEQAQALAGLSNARLWVQKAVLLILLNQPRLALTCCNQALWRSPSHTQAWLFRGVALHGLGKFRAAYRSYQRVLHPVAPAVANSVRRLCHDLALDQQAG